MFDWTVKSEIRLTGSVSFSYSTETIFCSYPSKWLFLWVCPALSFISSPDTRCVTYELRSSDLNLFRLHQIQKPQCGSLAARAFAVVWLNLFIFTSRVKIPLCRPKPRPLQLCSLTQLHPALSNLWTFYLCSIKLCNQLSILLQSCCVWSRWMITQQELYSRLDNLLSNPLPQQICMTIWIF